MNIKKLVLFVTTLFVLGISYSFDYAKIKTKHPVRIVKLEFHLCAFGVESDDFPNITGIVDFKSDTSMFEKSYYNPKYKSST